MATRAGEPITATGIAVPGPDGLVESRLARTDCVWHGHEVLRHYWSLPQNGVERERVCDPIADHASAELFGIVAPGRRAWKGGTVLVDPEGAELSGADMCLQRVVGRPQQGVPAPADDLLPRVKGRISGIFRGETIEFEYREWVIRPGAPIAVHGVVEMRDGRPVIVPPPGGRLRVERGDGDDSEASGPVPKGAGALLLGGGA
ncbi:GIDE domain-containing protein [Allosalinactinospora lopnorensis]|uniref:GIDE domain-containing protein n=1 Tax=Allosalinactinospora lopnorensis TaxID=1352348 RepID=UPI003083EE0B